MTSSERYHGERQEPIPLDELDVDGMSFTEQIALWKATLALQTRLRTQIAPVINTIGVTIGYGTPDGRHVDISARSSDEQVNILNLDAVLPNPSGQIDGRPVTENHTFPNRQAAITAIEGRAKSSGYKINRRP